MPRQGRLTVGRIKALRWVALSMAVVLAAVIAVLWVLGHQTKPELPTAEPAPGGAQQVGKGFDHTVTHEGRPLMRIRGKRDRRDQQGNLHVEEVLINAFQEDGTQYEVAADVATYNLEQKEARLVGHVSLVGPEGFALRTQQLTLKQGGRWLDANSELEFQYGTNPPLIGEANELHAQLNRGEFVLAGKVRVRANPRHAEPQGGPPPPAGEPFVLAAQVVVFQRSLHQLRANDKVLLKWGESHLDTERLAVHLSPEGNKMQFVRARWGVKAVFVDHDETARERRLIAEGENLAVLLDESGKQPTHLELQGDERQKAHLRRFVEGGDTFDLLAARTEADMALSRLTAAQAEGGVAVTDQRAQTPARHLTARTAHADFASDGTVSQLEVKGEVRVAEAGRGDLVADRAIVTTERTDAFGSPVQLTSPKGELRAPQIVYTRDNGIAHALGGVEAAIPPSQDNPLHKTPLAAGGEPVQVQSQEAFWRDEPRSFLFKGKVRAWSGDRVLRADQLRGEATDQQLSAAGGVETVWFMPPPKNPPGGEANGGQAPAPGPRQVRVNAETLTYSDKVHQLIYDGNVRVVDGPRTLRSKTLAVDLTEKGEARRMAARGEVRLDAPAEGRTISADQADYDVDKQVVVFHGSPVTLQDKKGGTLTGKQATYAMATGKVRVTAEAEGGT
jgi:LPS export ABC transporter protein LptC/lipopolysaccharide transport protein LptA